MLFYFNKYSCRLLLSAPGLTTLIAVPCTDNLTPWPLEKLHYTSNLSYMMRVDRITYKPLAYCVSCNPIRLGSQRGLRQNNKDSKAL